ncbi:MAG: AraC family transcriptional regulator [Chloroflexota bacterium]
MSTSYPPYEERSSDSPLVHSFGWGCTEREGVTPMNADSQCYLLITYQDGKTRVALGGAVTKTWYMPYSAGGEWLGIRFTTGTFMPHMPTNCLVNNLIYLPEAAGNRFWLNGCAWEVPALENADSFVKRLLQEEVLVHDPLLNAVLCDQPQDVSFSTVRRRFLRASGVTPGVMHQIQRARKAALLLKNGVSILDTVYETGYFDQPHLTRSLKHFMGYTPAQLLRAYSL